MGLVDSVFQEFPAETTSAPRPAPPRSGSQIVVSPLFRDFSVDEMVAVIAGLKLLSFERGDVILREGDPGASLYMLTSGRVRAFRKEPASERQKPLGDLDEGAFFGELSRRFGAPGDFAQAYVIAHEVGHHVQNLTGTMAKVDRQMQQVDARGRNALSVRLELQADCYAGIWGYFAQRRNKLEVGDLEEGFRAAAAVGDDEIQKRAQGYVVPESFTHGSAEQRLKWFRAGLESGDMRRCNTFG